MKIWKFSYTFSQTLETYVHMKIFYTIIEHKDQYQINELLKQENEQKQWLYQKLYQLPERERNVMILTINSGLKDEEIAELLNLTVSNLRVIRHRVINSLKKMSKEEI